MSFCRTADPVRDAEMSQQDNREFIVCDHCGQPIYKGDNNDEGDEFYQVGDMAICLECIDDFKIRCA